MDIKKQIGKRIKQARGDRTLKEIASKTKNLSISRVSNYEQGYRTPGPSEAKELANALGNINAPQILCLADWSQNSVNDITGTYELGIDNTPELITWDDINKLESTGDLPKEFLVNIKIERGELKHYNQLHATTIEPEPEKKTAYIIGKIKKTKNQVDQIDIFFYTSNGPKLYLTPADPEGVVPIKHKPETIQTLAWVLGGEPKTLSSYPS